MRLTRRHLMIGSRCEVDTTAIALCYYRHQPRSHASCLPFLPDVGVRNRSFRHQASESTSLPCGCPRLGRIRIRRRTHLHREPVAAILNHRLDVRLLAPLGRQHESRGQRHLDIGKGGVGAFHRPRSQPRNHRQLAALIAFQVGPLRDHFLGDLDFRIQMPDAPLGFVAHPLAIVAYVCG